jgi:hypothetical protein
LSAVASPGAISAPVPAWKAPTLRFKVMLVLGSLAFGALAGDLGTSGRFSHVIGLAIVLLPVAVWKRPWIGPSVLLGAAVLVEQGVQIPNPPITSSIPLFHALGPGHLQGADILLLFITVVYFAKGVRWHPRSHVTLAIGLVLLAVVWALIYGHMHGGDLRTSLMEARPYVYLSVSYWLSSVLITDRKAIQGLLWTLVGAVWFKAVQGIYVYFNHRHDYPRPESFIGHEASYFFVIYFVLVVALWLFHQPGRLRTLTTRMLPIVIFANLVNDRRAAYLMAGGAMMAIGVIAYHGAPRARRVLGRCVVLLVLVSAVYFPVMWNGSGSISQPARAVRSQISPSARDASSDVYRVQENADLKLNIKQGGLLGKGFGVKIDYALPIIDISSIDALIAYIPHNDVLDVMMRMGVLGGVAMWFLIGAGIIAGCRMARYSQREFAVVGAVLAAALVAYALMGAVDQGFLWFRIAIITGVLLGTAEAARRLARADGSSVASGLV